MKPIIKNAIDKHRDTLKFLEKNPELIKKIATLFISTLKNNGKIIFFGNGGSAADAQHLAAELVGRFKKKREALASISLTTNASILTALGNDFGFEEIFACQIEGLADSRDLAVGISTSGQSKNVIKAMVKAKEKKLATVGFLGKDGGKLKDLVDIAIVIPSQDTARVQEAHILLGHIICEIVENEILK